MAEQLWDLANLITGFSVAQCLATLFAIVKGDLNQWLKKAGDYYWSGVGMAIFTALYCAALLYCGSRGAQLDLAHRTIWLECTAGRIAAVILFAAILGVVFRGHWQNIGKFHPQIVNCHLPHPHGSEIAPALEADV